jgi:TetR/AcrR family transcriptional regulator, transcriptional repressor for nem operon
MARQSMREEIVGAALEQFRAHGFNAAGVKDITDAAGTPKGSFYNHFESKEALAVVALERYGATRRMQDLSDRRVEPVERVRRHFEFLRDEIAGLGFTQGCLLGNFGNEIADHSATIRAGVRQGLDAWSDALAGALTEAVQAGTIDPGLDPQTTALFILSAWQGAIIAARSERSPVPFDIFFGMVFGKLLAPPAVAAH